MHPVLALPARVGLTRIVGKHVSYIPNGERRVWDALGRRLGRGYGEFYLLSPMIVDMVATEANRENTQNRSYRWRSVYDRIRAGAARQRLAVILIYKVRLTIDRGSAPVTVDAIRATRAGGRARTLSAQAFGALVDVRTGYSYGTVSAVAQGRLFRPAKLSAVRIRLRAVKKLAVEVEGMARRLGRRLPYKVGNRTAAH